MNRIATLKVKGMFLLRSPSQNLNTELPTKSHNLWLQENISCCSWTVTTWANISTRSAVVKWMHFPPCFLTVFSNAHMLPLGHVMQWWDTFQTKHIYMQSHGHGSSLSIKKKEKVAIVAIFDLLMSLVWFSVVPKEQEHKPLPPVLMHTVTECRLCCSHTR